MRGEKIKTAARVLLGTSLVFAGLSHLTFAKKEFEAQVPDWVPMKKEATVLYSGVAEVALGSALALSPNHTKRILGKIAAAFFVAVFPGNVSQYVHHRNAFGLNTQSKRFTRLLFQPLLVWWALKSTH